MSHRSRFASDVRMNAPLRVPTSTRTPLITYSFLLSSFRIIFYSLVALLLHRQPHDLPHRPDLDRSDARARNPSSDADRLVEILGIDKEVAGDLLARLHERTVGHETLAVPDPNDRRRRCRLQRRSTQIFPVGVELMCQLDRFLEHLLSLGLAELAEGLLVVVNQQHVFHRLYLHRHQMVVRESPQSTTALLV